MVRASKAVILLVSLIGSHASGQAIRSPNQSAKAAEGARSPAAVSDHAVSRSPVSASPEMSVADLTAKVRDSTVVISVLGRDGERSSLGAGFAIGKDGLIATNLHVIGEARPIVVRTSDGKKLEVVEIHATDRARDLAVIRVKARDFKPLELGDSDLLKQGQEVVAVGNPRGLEYSVVSGVVSGIRTIEEKPMIQLAIPIEQGNSGGPLLDRHGRVQGILTMKSVVTENLGFAVAINALKPLLSKPNPLPIEQWLTIGALDATEWTPLFSARWRQRAGRVLVEGRPNEIGGRSLLVAKRSVPEPPFEMAVWVRLQREDGAAGLAFQFHDVDRHYGFYPSNGRIRLSRFDGPDFYSWHVLNEVPTAAYRPGEWNHLKVRVEKDKILGYVNDVLVVESTDEAYRHGKVALASFRDTHAEFKGFDIGKTLPSPLPSRAVTERVTRIAAELKLDQPPDSKTIDRLVPDSTAGVLALRQQADRREREAKQLRRLADAVQLRRVQKELVAIFEHKNEKEIDLLRAALLVARIDNDDLDVDAYVHEVDRMAARIRPSLKPNDGAEARLKALDEYLFKKRGFHGSRTDFDDRSNSYINEVIDDREGLPITLSVLYIEMARRLDVNVVGVGLPGRFMVRLDSTNDNATLIDVFEGGRRVPRQDIETHTAALVDRPLTPDDWRAKSKKEIVSRLVQNLSNVAAESNDTESVLKYVEVQLALDPGSLADHWQRAVLCFKTGRHSESLAEANWLLAKDPKTLSQVADPEVVRQLKDHLESLP